MTTKKIISFFIFATIILVSYQCKNEKTDTTNNNTSTKTTTPTKTVSASKTADPNITGGTIKGKLTNAENLKVFIEKSNMTGSNEIIGVAEIDGSGNFSVPMPQGLEAGIYRMRIGVQKMYLIFSGNESTVNVTGDVANFKKYGLKVSGSDASSEFFTMMSGFAAQTPTAEAAKTKLSAAKNPLVSAWAAYMMFPNQGGIPSIQAKHAVQKPALAKMQAQFPTANITKELAAAIQSESAQLAAQLAKQKIKVGEVAPDISMKSPDGKTYSLSDLKGKVVLLDFWASWCGPCRKANPHVVELYKKYNKQGFEVFSVSLDGIHAKVKARLKTQADIDKQLANAKNKWKKAIKDDGLLWKYHVSDLKHWASVPAKIYGASSIPKTFLIGRDGKIKAINPRGAALEPALKKEL